jgi:hypothetical protein
MRAAVLGLICSPALPKCGYMAVSSLGAARSFALSDSLLIEGFRLMRERLAIYLVLAGICAASAFVAFPRVDIYGALNEAANGRPLSLFTQPPVSVVLVLAIAAVLFVLPSALRLIEPSFRMTMVRYGIALATLALVGVLVDLGTGLAVIPGVAAAVLLSQALVGALLRAPDRPSVGGLRSALGGALRGSYEMTRGHFVTTLGVVLASLAIFVFPGSCALLVLWILGVKVSASLIVTSPLLLLTFVYFECVRYSLIVRWYRRLAEDTPQPSP